MAEYNIISQTIWNSEKYKSLKKDHIAKLVYLYFINSPHSNSCGCYTVHVGYIMADLNMVEEEVVKSIDRLSEVGLIEYDYDENTVYIHRFLDHNPPRNPKHAIKVFNDSLSIGSKRFRVLCMAQISAILKKKGWKLSEDKQEILDRLSIGQPTLVTPNPTQPNPTQPNAYIGDFHDQHDHDPETGEIFELIPEQQNTVEDDFEKWWKYYPDHGPDGARGAAYKGNKKSARERFQNLAKKDKSYENFRRCLADGTRNYREFLAKNPRQQGKHAVTWLNQRGWEDDYAISAPAKTTSGSGAGYSLEAAVNQALADQTRRPEGRQERLKALGLDDD